MIRRNFTRKERNFKKANSRRRLRGNARFEKGDCLFLFSLMLLSAVVSLIIFFFLLD